MFELKRRQGMGVPVVRQKEGVAYLVFPNLEETQLVTHLCTTRIGGVSQGIYDSMNVSFYRGDENTAVLENIKRIASVLGAKTSDMVAVNQTHTTNVVRVDVSDCGKGILKPTDYQDIDGMITNVPGVILATLYADCVPLYFVDTVKKAIGLSHSGWRGTVNKMGIATVQKMQEEFGSNPKDIMVAIGPSICQSCYEIGVEVAQAFEEAFPREKHRILIDKGNGKFQLDLWEANRMVLLEAGILEKHIQVTDICTCCNADYLFSHRASQGQRGSLGAYLGLRKD